MVEQKTPDYDELIKIWVIGESATGKTQLIQRYSNGTFKSKSAPTLEVNHSIKTL